MARTTNASQKSTHRSSRAPSQKGRMDPKIVSASKASHANGVQQFPVNRKTDGLHRVQKKVNKPVDLQFKLDALALYQPPVKNQHRLKVDLDELVEKLRDQMTTQASEDLRRELKEVAAYFKGQVAANIAIFSAPSEDLEGVTQALETFETLTETRSTNDLIESSITNLVVEFDKYTRGIYHGRKVRIRTAGKDMRGKIAEQNSIAAATTDDAAPVRRQPKLMMNPLANRPSAPHVSGKFTGWKQAPEEMIEPPSPTVSPLTAVVMEEQRQYRAERQASLDRRAKDQAANLDSDPATEETHRWDRLMAAQLEAAKTKAAQELCAVERVAVGYSKEDVSRTCNKQLRPRLPGVDPKTVRKAAGPLPLTNVSPLTAIGSVASLPLPTVSPITAAPASTPHPAAFQGSVPENVSLSNHLKGPQPSFSLKRKRDEEKEVEGDQPSSLTLPAAPSKRSRVKKSTAAAAPAPTRRSPRITEKATPVREAAPPVGPPTTTTTTIPTTNKAAASKAPPRTKNKLDYRNSDKPAPALNHALLFPASGVRLGEDYGNCYIPYGAYRKPNEPVALVRARKKEEAKRKKEMKAAEAKSDILGWM